MLQPDAQVLEQKEPVQLDELPQQELPVWRPASLLLASSPLLLF